MFKKSVLICGFTVAAMHFCNAQTTVYAYIKDEKGKPVERAEVDMKGSEENMIADKIGYFQFVDLKPGNYQRVRKNQSPKRRKKKGFGRYCLKFSSLQLYRTRFHSTGQR